MPNFRKKPAVVEAEQYTGANLEAIQVTLAEKDPKVKDTMLPYAVSDDFGPFLSVPRETGEPARANVGDWIVKNPDGRLAVYKDASFRAAFERVD